MAYGLKACSCHPLTNCAYHLFKSKEGLIQTIDCKRKEDRFGEFVTERIKLSTVDSRPVLGTGLYVSQI